MNTTVTRDPRGRKKHPVTSWKGGVIYKEFGSMRDAAKWIIENGHQNKSIGTIQVKISSCIKQGTEIFGYGWTSPAYFQKVMKRERFKKNNPHLISQHDLKQIFQIKNDRTIKTYLSENSLPQPSDIIEKEAFYSRKEIYKMIGLEEIPNEPFLTPKDLCALLNMEKRQDLVSFVKRKNIPHYGFKEKKGSPRYFLRSEVDAALKLNDLGWNLDFPSYVARTVSLRNIFNAIVTLTATDNLKKNQLNIFNKVILEGKSGPAIAREEGISAQTVIRTFQAIYPHIMSAIADLAVGLKQVDVLIFVNKQLTEENEILRNKLKDLCCDENPIQVKPFENAPFSVRVKHLLEKMEVNSLFGVSQKFTRKEAKRFQNVGEGTLTEMDDLLKKNNLGWKGDEPVTASNIISSHEEEKKPTEAVNNEITVLKNVEESIDNQITDLKNTLVEVSKKISQLESRTQK